MNIYFLLEDSKSSFLVFPEWLKILLPNFERVNLLTQLKDNQYCIESGHGYPAIEHRFKEAVEFIKDYEIQLNYFVLVYDSDDRNQEEIQKRINEYTYIFDEAKISASFHVLVMRKCFETWLMGNRKVYPYNNDKFYKYESFFNVSVNNPEDMWYPSDKGLSISMYHYKYFQEMLKCSIKKNYSKKKPLYVSTENFLEGLLERIEKTEDLKIFKEFIDIVNRVDYTTYE